MAAAAETLIARPEQIEYDEQFRDITSSLVDVFSDTERPPESEIYGRSLSTIHRLGAFMIDNSLPEIINSPESDQARIEFFTSVEEGFGTDMELGGGLEVRDFDRRPVLNGQVMSKNLKTPVSGMTEAGLVCAAKTAKADKRFFPQLTRSEWDHKNALLVDKMARGETNYNTRIAISPFPEEAAAQSGDDYWRDIGYVPHLKRGFVQLYHAASGEVITGSLSFDGSDKQQLRKIFSKYSVEIPAEEITDNWLQYAITGTLSEDEAKILATTIADQAGIVGHSKNTNTVDVTKEYQSIMDCVFNESYIYVCESLFRGYQTEEVRELVYQLADRAQHFNKRYKAALYKMRANKDQFTDDDSVVLHELLVYSTIEMMRALHLKKTEPRHDHIHTNQGVQLDPIYLQSINSSSFQNVLSGFGAEGARNKRTYSACGLSISPGETSSLVDDPQAAYGGLDSTQNNLAEDADDYGPLTFKCPKGHWNRRPRAKSPKDFLSHCMTCRASLKC
jgi:hypothetical protein